MGSSISTKNTISSPPQFSDDSEVYIELEQEKVLENQLLNYSNSLEKHKLQLNTVEKSFIPVAHSSIINIMGRKQCESYQNYNSFTITDLNIMRSIHKIAHFDVDKHSEVKHLIDPLKKVFKEGGTLKQVAEVIREMKNIQIYKGCSFTTIDYQLLDILEYITEICLNNDPSNIFTYWTNIFDMLFRGTNIKLSNRKSAFEENGCASSSGLAKDTILFQCHSQTFGQQNNIELSTCNMTFRNEKDSMKKNDEKETIVQSNSIIVNKKILDYLVKDFNYNEEDLIDFYPIYIQLAGYNGYLYSIRLYKGVYVASQVCENTLFIPQTISEFQSFLFEGHVLEILCNLKRHYVGIAKVVRHAASNKNNSSWINAK